MPSGFWEKSGKSRKPSVFLLAFAPGVNMYMPLFFFLLFLRAAAGRTQKSPRRFWGAAGGGAEEKEEEEAPKGAPHQTLGLIEEGSGRFGERGLSIGSLCFFFPAFLLFLRAAVAAASFASFCPRG